MSKWPLIAGGVIMGGAVVGVMIGQWREASKAEQLRAALSQSASRPVRETVDFEAFKHLPSPVGRYFRHVLTDGQELIRSAVIRQSGKLRTGIRMENWFPFTATHLAVPPAIGFVWNARVEMPPAIHLRVLDSYVSGIGSGRVSLLSAFPVSSQTGALEMNSGALHRYLAEAVCYPTALLPGNGLVWSPVNEESATATLTNNGTTVSLEFRFSEVGEVTGIHTPGRWGHFDGEYKQVAWEGHFRNYQLRAGMRVPLYGEVGWYDDRTLKLVWKGNITDVAFERESLNG